MRMSFRYGLVLLGLASLVPEASAWHRHHGGTRGATFGTPIVFGSVMATPGYYLAPNGCSGGQASPYFLAPNGCSGGQASPLYFGNTPSYSFAPGCYGGQASPLYYANSPSYSMTPGCYGGPQAAQFDWLGLLLTVLQRQPGVQTDPSGLAAKVKSLEDRLELFRSEVSSLNLKALRDDINSTKKTVEEARVEIAKLKGAKAGVTEADLAALQANLRAHVTESANSLSERINMVSNRVTETNAGIDEMRKKLKAAAVKGFE